MRTRKTLADRVTYYVRKVAERGKVHPAHKIPRSHKYRFERLMKYKARLAELHELEK